MSALRKFSSQAEPEILEGLQEIAEREGRQFQAVLAKPCVITCRASVSRSRDATCSKHSRRVWKNVTNSTDR